MANIDGKQKETASKPTNKASCVRWHLPIWHRKRDKKDSDLSSDQFHKNLLRSLTLTTAAILLTGIFIIVGFYSRSTLLYFREQTENQAQNVLRQAQASLEDKTGQFHNLIVLLYLNPDLQTLLFNEYYYDVPALVASRQITTYFAPVDNQLNGVFTDVSNISIYTTNNTLRAIPGELEPISSVLNTEWYQAIEKNPIDGTMWTITKNEAGETMLSAIHRLRNLRISSFSANFLGYIKLDFIPERFFSNVLLSAENGSDWLLVTGPDNKALSTSHKQDADKLAALLFAAPLNTESIPDNTLPIERRTLRIDDIPYVVWGSPVAGTDWICWYGVSEQSMLEAMNRVNLPVLLVLIVMTAAMALASWYAASRLTGRIGRLAHAMERLESGEFSVRVQDHGKDEIGMLSNGFNIMADRLGELVKREYLARMQQREYDLSALQAQLHPHFLYNTLASISWLGMQAGVKEIPAITNALARFYRLSLSKGKNFISVGDEVKQVQAYLNIMSIRYKDKITAEYVVPEELTETWTLKLILQPFVENAILHGLTAQKKHIHITVAAERDEDTLVFTVADDGIGIPAEQMPVIKDGLSESGYGIVNVGKRIRTYFGDQYGLDIMSTSGEGTVVTIKTPIMDTEPMES